MTAPLFADPNRDLLERDPRILQSPNQLIDPRRVTQDNLTPEQWARVPMVDGPYRTLEQVSQGLAFAIAFVLTRSDVDLLYNATGIISAVGGSELKRGILRITSSYRNIWNYMANPALQTAARLGSTTVMSVQDEKDFAQYYANQMFDYINDTSADALVEGYHSQLSEKWSPQLAWHRAASGYGVDRPSMNQYIKMLRQGEGREILPSVATRFVERAIQTRALKIAGEEAFRAKEMGKTVYWMQAVKRGALPPSARRRWRTAEDERVCTICGPMDEVDVAIDEQFLLPDGNKLWAPGVHPNCRCTVELTYPEFSHTIKKREPWEAREHPRGRGGRFAEVAEREVEEQTDAPVQMPTPTVVQMPAPARVEAPVAMPVQAPVSMPVATQAPVTAPVSAPVSMPVAIPVSLLMASAKRINLPNYRHSSTPYVAYANDWMVANGDYGAWAHDEDGNTIFHQGDRIDIHRPVLGRMKYRNYDKLSDEQKIEEIEADKRATEAKSRRSITAKPFTSPTQIAYGAGERYLDADPDAARKWEDFTEKHGDEYEKAISDFQYRAVRNAPTLIRGMGSAEIEEIYTEAGERGKYFMAMSEGRPIADLKEELIREVSDPVSGRNQFAGDDLQNSYLHYMMMERSDRVPPRAQYEPDLVDHHDLMSQMGIQRKVVNVFEFSSFEGGYMPSTKEEDDKQGGPTALIQGKYQVTNVITVPIAATTWHMGHPAVSAVRFVQLEPIIEP